jgi:hypothetical protein
VIDVICQADRILAKQQLKAEIFALENGHLPAPF